MYELVTILGPTACGKTHLAVALAARLKSEVISGDSRQVYRRMDIGTGKDLSEYTYEGRNVPYHLIDIVEPGSKYTLFHFQEDFLKAFRSIRKCQRIPVFCGGSGLYLESVLKAFSLSPVPINEPLRASLSNKSLEELTSILASFRPLHNNTDTDTCTRAIRAIEIETYNKEHPQELRSFPSIPSLVIGLDVDREIRRQRIANRLEQRLKEGLVEEIRSLLESGVSADNLIYYGLEYRFVTLYVIGQMGYDEMVERLRIAICQFAKRQMTWFRGMEKRGIHIHWIDNTMDTDSKVDTILSLLKHQTS